MIGMTMFGAAISIPATYAPAENCQASRMKAQSTPALGRMEHRERRTSARMSPRTNERPNALKTPIAPRNTRGKRKRILEP